MSFVKHVAIASILIGVLGFAVPANAADAKLSDCIQMAKQVSVAINSAQSSENTEQAKDMARNARTFCSANMYGRGVALYGKALTLLGNKS